MMKEKVSRVYIENTEPNTFKYGFLDCAIWVGKYVKLLTGNDFYSQFENRYKTWSGGRDEIRNAGHESLTDYMDKNFSSIPVLMAKRGDVVFFRGAIGICQGTYSWFLNKSGKSSKFTYDCTKAWQIEKDVAKCPRK